ncbi:C-type lectin lectoxin-Lio2-like [Pollicipes pollicipes]|uniref:C-type lectin lectoxin-Lio2-like n=1 Tax=Pollicipes pollicipes TaxID=41117 RepID=UPI0018852B4A|nr:C-type lectin lectoxin-Lio2-like [Pollicipes pollicipes]
MGGGYLSGGLGSYLGQGGGYFSGGQRSHFGRRRAGGFSNGYNKFGLFFSFLDPYLAGKQFTWQAANFQCAIRGLRLVSLDDPYKNKYVSRKIARYNVRYIWTSGMRNGYKFFWANGRPVKYGFTNWSFTGRLGLPQPDNYQGNEYCLAVLNHYYGDGIVWHDVACHHKKSFVCEPVNYY